MQQLSHEIQHLDQALKINNQNLKIISVLAIILGGVVLMDAIHVGVACLCGGMLALAGIHSLVSRETLLGMKDSENP